MLISVVNHTGGAVSDEALHVAIRAINRQIAEDFEPYWHMGASLRLEGRSSAKPDIRNVPELRGDAVLYIWNGTDVDDALGYHELTHHGVPYGFVFIEVAKAVGENWTVTLSHEALELLADPDVNLLVQGPHPTDKSKTVFHWYEMCDAVQAETYKIDEVEVSNFVLPLYFTAEHETGSRNDFLGKLHNAQSLRSFGINPGGYIGFYNPETNEHEQVALEGDEKAARRLSMKMKVRRGRRSGRYQQAIQARAMRRDAPVPKGRGVTILKHTGVAEAEQERRA